MINPYHSLCQNLPERRPPAGDDEFSDARRLRAWIERLPRANQKLYFRELLRVLEIQSRQRHEGFGRLELLEVLRPVWLEVATLLSSRLQGSTFPLTGMKAQTADELMALQRSMALAYRLAVIEACAPAGKAPALRGAQVAQVLVRAMYHHVRWLASCHFLYRSPEPGVWAQLYALAAFAGALGLDGKAVDDAAEPRALSVVMLQNQAVLMSMANPYRFSQREQLDLWALARDAAKLMALTPQRFAANGVVVRIDQDQPPVYASRAPAPEEGDVLWVDARALVTAIRTTLERAKGASEVTLRLSRSLRPSLAAHFVARVLEGWGQDSARAFPRLEGGYTLDSVIGLGSLHYQLAGRRDVDVFTRQLSGLKAAPVALDERAAWARSGSDAIRADPQPVQVLDQSLGGYRLRWSGVRGARARVGELVGLALPRGEGNSDWMVGVVRWLRYDEDGMETGLELLGRRARAVALCSLDARASVRVPIRALGLLPAAEKWTVLGGELFLVSDLGGLEGERLQVVRSARRWQSDEGEGAWIYECSALQVIEAVGHYLLVQALPLEPYPVSAQASGQTRGTPRPGLRDR